VENETCARFASETGLQFLLWNVFSSTFPLLEQRDEALEMHGGCNFDFLDQIGILGENLDNFIFAFTVYFTENACTE